MKGRPIDQLVYETMFPKPKPSDPQNFHSLLQRQLVQEVRSETASFYGSLESREAQYPGLDYSLPAHRRRLSRFPWHRRLFRAFDALELTSSEIAGLTKWEGTKWAKERFEKESGTTIRDTTGDCINDWIEPGLRGSNRTMQESQEGMVEDMEDAEQEGVLEDMDDGSLDESDGEIESVGVELNERLRAAAAQRDAGNSTTVMDEEWEQWLKEAAEAGGIPFLADQSILNISSHSDSASGRASTTAMPPRLLNAARLGQWSQIPDFLHNMVRQNIEANNRAAISSTLQNSPPRRESAPARRPIASTSTLNGQTRQSAAALSSTTPPSNRRTSLTRAIQPTSSGLIGSAYGLPRWSPQSSTPQSQQPRPRS